MSTKPCQTIVSSLNSSVSHGFATLIDHISSSNQLCHFLMSGSWIEWSLYPICVSICPQDVRTMWICSLQKCDWDKLREALSYAPWHVISTFDDNDDQWEMFHSLLLDSFSSFVLLCKVSSWRAKRPTPWFTDCIATKIKEKTMLNKLLLSQVMKGTGRSITKLKMN